MAPNLSGFNNTYQPTSKAMSAEQFEQIVTAILEGKYSWACVLILRFGGYNPVHYIPYRTYKRLIKDNRLTQANDQPSFETLKECLKSSGKG